MKRKILLAGAGLSGCVTARLLRERGHDVCVIERSREVGGLCVSRVSPNGFTYEPFGARTFHTRNARVKDFVARFGSFNSYVHRKSMLLNGKLLPFPVTPAALDLLDEREQIRAELAQRPAAVDMTNFETAAQSIFGPTLYRCFVENYTIRMWGTHPRNLGADWAPQRLALGSEEDDSLFRGQWQGLPQGGYSGFLAKMVEGLPLHCGTTSFDAGAWDVVVFTAPIDQFLDYALGRLRYRSLQFSYGRDEAWEQPRHGTINLPQHDTFIRKCNFKILHQEDARPGNWIQYQAPCEADDRNVPMYPFPSASEAARFDRYLRLACASRNLCPHGRLGLFQYLDMDHAVEVSMAMVPVIEAYPDLRPAERYERIAAVRALRSTSRA